MRKAIILLLILLISTGNQLSAHDLLTSKFELQTDFEKGAILKAYLTQAGLHHALKKKYPKQGFAKQGEYEAMIISYLKEHISIKANEIPMEFGFGAVKLGSHETDVIMHIKNYPKAVSKLEVNIDAFQENGNHHSVFWWFAPEETSKFVLAEKNDFHAFFEIGKTPIGKEVLQSRSTLVDEQNIAICIILLFVVFFAIFQWKTKSTMGDFQSLKNKV